VTVAHTVGTHRHAPQLVDVEQLIKHALKVLGRRFGLRAISIRAESEKPEAQAQPRG
jgi:hypothetical protein